jgi:hypothetical protein
MYKPNIYIHHVQTYRMYCTPASSPPHQARWIARDLYDGTISSATPCYLQYLLASCFLLAQNMRI